MKTIVYARVSTEKQDLERQIGLAKEYCQLHNHTIVGTIEEKMSGANTDRDGLHQLMQLTKDDCELVVMSELSRLTREEEFQRIFNRIDTLRDKGISIVFLDDPENVYSNDNPINFVQFIMLGFRAMGARDELLKIRNRMKTGRVSLLQRFPYMVTSSLIPFGFEKYPNPDYDERVKGVQPKSLIRINRAEAAIIRQCYEMAITGNSCPKIADFLNNSGFIHKNHKGNNKWYGSEVNRLLKNRLYIGERTVEGVTHQIEPIVSVEMFEQAAKCMSQNRCIVSDKKDRFNPLKGLLFCGNCGLGMMIVSRRNELVYKCLHDAQHNPNKQLKDCDNSSLHCKTLISAVWNATVDRMKTSEYYGKSQLTIDDYNAQSKSVEGTIASLVKQMRPITDEIRKRYKQLDAMTDPDIIELVEEKLANLKEQRETLRLKIAAAQKEYDKLQLKISDLKQEISWGDDNRDLTIYEKAEFFNKVIDKVLWCGQKYKRNYGSIVINFKNGDTVTIDIKND